MTASTEPRPVRTGAVRRLLARELEAHPLAWLTVGLFAAVHFGVQAVSAASARADFAGLGGEPTLAASVVGVLALVAAFAGAGLAVAAVTALVAPARDESAGSGPTP